MRRRFRLAFAGIGWIATGLVLAMLIRAIHRPAPIRNPENPAGRKADSVVPESSGPSEEIADLLAQHAPHPDVIDPAALKAIREHPAVLLVDIRTPWEWQGGRIPGAVLIPPCRRWENA